MHNLSVTNASKKETRKKKNYSEAEIDVLLMEEQMRAKTLFESLSGGIMAPAAPASGPRRPFFFGPSCIRVSPAFPSSLFHPSW